MDDMKQNETILILTGFFSRGDVFSRFFPFFPVSLPYWNFIAKNGTPLLDCIGRWSYQAGLKLGPPAQKLQRKLRPQLHVLVAAASSSSTLKRQRRICRLVAAVRLVAVAVVFVIVAVLVTVVVVVAVVVAVVPGVVAVAVIVVVAVGVAVVLS